jgi:hypothetical protein
VSARRIAPVACAVLALGVSACGGGKSSAPAHALGEQVVVQHTEIASKAAKAPTTKLGITVLHVRKGTQAELKAGGFQIDAADQSKTPYYVDVTYANKGTQAIKRQLYVGLEDKDGNLISATTIFDFGGKPFAKCPNISDGMLQPGESYSSCTLFLVPDGHDPAKVSFLPYDPKHETQFVYWKTA